MQKKSKEKQRKEKENDILFDKLFDKSISYITKNYKECDISGSSNNIRIKKTGLVYDKNNIKFDVTLISDGVKPKFNVTITYNDLVLSYITSGFDRSYVDFKAFILNIIFPWYLLEEKKRSQNHKKNYDYYDDYGYKDDYYNSDSKKTTPPPNNKNESDEKKNKRRRYELLKDILDGHNRHLKRIEEWERLHAGKKHEERTTLENEINVTKSKINLMNKQFQFESVYYYKHLKPIFS